MHFERLLPSLCYSVTALFTKTTHLLVLIWSSKERQQFHSLSFSHHCVWPKDVCFKFDALYSAWVLFTCMCGMRDVTE